MSSLVERLVSRAFVSAAPSEANDAIGGVREARSVGAAPALSYEVALPAFATDEYLTSTVLPRLVYFLDCHGVKLPGSPEVFVSLFTSEGLFFIESADLVSLAAESRGLTLEEAHRRYGQNGSGDPLLLG
jgi:hypothetical protein